VSINLNRLLGRSFVPHPRKAICIETSGRCNLKCRFCAYPKRGPLGFLNMDDFISAVTQASETGVRTIWLTPMLGEVFADPNLPEKLEYLEQFDGINAYSFYTNFILCNDTTIQQFEKLKKLTSIHISIYGHDEDTFQRITQRPSSQFKKLQRNLLSLRRLLKNWQPIEGVHFSIRTLGGITDDNLPKTDLIQKLSELSEIINVDCMVATEYDNWGGTLTSADTAPIGIDLFDGTGLYRAGACTLLFSGPRVASDKSVHACACRDIDNSLLIGNLADSSLRDIISLQNPAYQKIIENQQSGRFSKNCQSCSMYRSVYDHRPGAQDQQLTTLALKDARKLMAQ